MPKQSLEIDVPEGYTAIGYRVPNKGELCIGVHSEVYLANNTNHLRKAVVVNKNPWRAEYGSPYYVVTGEGLHRVQERFENLSVSCGIYYRSGNYFKTKEEAEEVASKIKTLLAQ